MRCRCSGNDCFSGVVRIKYCRKLIAAEPNTYRDVLVKPSLNNPVLSPVFSATDNISSLPKPLSAFTISLANISIESLASVWLTTCINN
ncbi:unnamed protein product [Larinioides sclopetarius]|uniref:Uncharacterized protein n=1 Tax=Larinioides sclopetarius TaxID=280406 RepID=A0AAV1ZCP0_9ARAC